jgi:hypothetical protein
MKQSFPATILLIAFLCAGCTSTVTRETLMRKAARYSLTLSPDITYYCGSQRAFDYFYLQPTGPTTFREAHWLRVRESEDTVSDRFEYTTDRSHWRILVGLDRKEREPSSDTPANMAPSTGHVRP